MSSFSAIDLTNMRSAQDAHMMDTCVLQARVQTLNTLREKVETWPADSAALSCGLDMKPGSERDNANMVVLRWDATIRLPIAQTPDAADRIKVTKRFGEDTTDITFEIVGPIQRGPSGIRLRLKRVET